MAPSPGVSWSAGCTDAQPVTMPLRPLIATYRLQLCGALDFVEAAARVPYLKKLGISHLYLSPVLDAAAGSLHGYDVVNHTRLSRELGGEEGFATLVAAAHGAGLGLVLDLVPNHMSIADARNRWWWDVLENGRSGRWAHAFDVDWDPPEQRLKHVVLLPILGDHLYRVLQTRSLKLVREGARFVICYHQHRFPVAPRSLGGMLQHAAKSCGEPQLAFLADSFAGLPAPTDLERSQVERGHRDREVLYGLLDAFLAQSAQCAEAVDHLVAKVNETPQLMDALLELQNYRLAFWRAAERDLDYRRFFDVNSLVGLRMEDPEVFTQAHALIATLHARGDIDGLRVDHVDGLADPAGYLARLRALVPGATIHVEKILGVDEALPAWPVDGTTGYDHGADVTALFTLPSAQGLLRDLDEELTGKGPEFSQLATASRQQVLRELLGSDVNRLANTLVRLGERYCELRDYSRHELRDLVAAAAAAFPVYRSYVVPADRAVLPADEALITRAIGEARGLAPNVDAALFDFLGDLLLLRRTGALESDFVSRFQQLSAPAMAKGVEDTAFYRYTTLLALAEVGGSPERFHLELDAFHARNQAAQRAWPKKLNATSTHDSKRSADVRARLVAMSQVPALFAQLAREFFRLTQKHLTADLPDAKLRMTALQTMVGAWPLDAERFKATLEKSAREAKVFTSWVRPNPAYDAAVQRFAAAVIADAQVREKLDAFVLALLPASRTLSLASTLLKCTCPGVPDFYQGTELWNLSLVDPDNRGAVNWKLREQAIEDPRVPTVEGDEVGLTKLFVIRRALALRNERPGLFDEGAAYVPLDVLGPDAAAIVAFARVAKDGGAAVAVVCRWPRVGWANTSVVLPSGRFASCFDARGGLSGTVPVATLFARLPVALLASEPKR